LAFGEQRCDVLDGVPHVRPQRQRQSCAQEQSLAPPGRATRPVRAAHRPEQSQSTSTSVSRRVRGDRDATPGRERRPARTRTSRLFRCRPRTSQRARACRGRLRGPRPCEGRSAKSPTLRGNRRNLVSARVGADWARPLPRARCFWLTRCRGRTPHNGRGRARRRLHEPVCRTVQHRARGGNDHSSTLGQAGVLRHGPPRLPDLKALEE
jgi:hypothetical protein